MLTRIASSPYAYLHYRDEHGVEWIEVVVPSRVTAAASYEIVRRLSPDELAERVKVVGWAAELIAETRSDPERYLDHDHVAELQALRAGPTRQEEWNVAYADELLDELCEPYTGGWFNLVAVDGARLRQIPKLLRGFEKTQPQVRIADIPVDQIRTRVLEKIGPWLRFGPHRHPPSEARLASVAERIIDLFDRFFAHRPLTAAGALYTEPPGPWSEWYGYRSPWVYDQLNYDLLLETPENLYVFHCGWSS